jgi:DNA modification methylase
MDDHQAESTTKPRGKKPAGFAADPVKETLRATSHARSKTEKRTNEHERRSTDVARRNDLMPNLTIELIRTSDLLASERRVRKFDRGDMMEVANNLSAFGFVQPLVIGRDGQSIVDGELRFEAARWLGLEEVPCILLATYSKAEERALKIALNRLGQRRAWNFDVLKLELQELLLEEQPIELLGFDSIELDQIMLDEEEEPDEVFEVSERDPVSRSGDLWLLGEHRLICGDARDASVHARLLGDDKVQLMLTDPPYNIAVSTIVSTKHEEFAFASGEMSKDEFLAFLRDFLAAAYPSLVAGAVTFAFMDWRQIGLLLQAGSDNDLELLNIIAWVKANAGMGSMYRSQHELVAMFKKAGEHKNRIQLGRKGRNRANVWFAPGAGTLGTDARELLKEHPTSKPVQMLVDAILDVTDPGDIVLDPFGGSGSTLIAADKLKRRARLIEYEPKYCDVIIRRWQQTAQGQAVLEETGETYDEVDARRSDEQDDIR